MKKFLFWVFVTLLLAVAVHISTVFMVPRLEGGARVTKAMSGGDLNRLTVLTSEKDAQSILGIANPDLVYAVCPFDITQRPIFISAQVPGRYWSMSVYGEDGSTLYTLNDKQAGVQSFTAELRLNGQNSIVPTQAVQGNSESLVIQSAFERGVVVFRAFAGESAQRQRAREQLSQTRCTTNRASAGLN
ncbi:MAG: DUF1254 domain-containing protein [Hyphomicrobiales bacterium]